MSEIYTLYHNIWFRDGGEPTVQWVYLSRSQETLKLKQKIIKNDDVFGTNSKNKNYSSKMIIRAEIHCNTTSNIFNAKIWPSYNLLPLLTDCPVYRGTVPTSEDTFPLGFSPQSED